MGERGGASAGSCGGRDSADGAGLSLQGDDDAGVPFRSRERRVGGGAVHRLERGGVRFAGSVGRVVAERGGERERSAVHGAGRGVHVRCGGVGVVGVAGAGVGLNTFGL